MSIDSILGVEDGQEVTAGQVIARIPKERIMYSFIGINTKSKTL